MGLKIDVQTLTAHDSQTEILREMKTTEHFKEHMGLVKPRIEMY